MKPNFSFTFLGTSTSVGVPVIGCNCKICLSSETELIRTRASALVQTPEISILVDSGPDLREQALREKITQVDAVLYTHAHLDHIVGFDELRAFCWRRDEPLPLYGSDACISEIQRMFSWAFSPENQYKGYVKPDPKITHGSFELADVTITPIPVIHGNTPTQGYRFDSQSAPSIAYIPDVKTIPEASIPLLTDIDILMIDSLHRREHQTHMTFTEALSTAARLNAKRTFLTHISHELDVPEEKKNLPTGVSFAYDGLKLTF